MKKKPILYITAFLIMAALPFLSFGGTKNAALNSRGTSSSQSESVRGTEKTQTSDDPNKDSYQKVFKILDTSSGSVVEVDDKTFCIGAVAYEMLPSFETEALKAQCVACYTHFCRIRRQQSDNADKELNGADFQADLSKGEYFLSDEQMREKWGNLYEKSKSKITAAVDSVFGEVLTDDGGNYIDAAYHAISSGETENAKDIFGKDDKHLISVASPGDRLAPEYKSVCEFSDEEFKKIILAENKDADLSGKPEKWIGKTERTKAGAVKSITVGGKTFGGADIRGIFSLRSACFSITHGIDGFKFTVLGYGHGVGMSQYGAQYMALQGSDYRQILNMYYSDVKITAEKT